MIFDALFRSDPMENPQVSLSDNDGIEEMFGLGGTHVTPETGMRLSAVYSCIYILSSSLAQLPLHVLRHHDNKTERAKDHPLFYLLHDEPNPWHSSYDWREVTQSDVCGHGNGITEIVRSRRGEIQELKRHKAWLTSLENRVNRSFYVSTDECADAAGGRAIQMEDIAHIRAIGSDGRWGTSPIRQHAETIGLGLSAQKYGNSFFEQNGRPSALVTAKTPLVKDSWERLKSAWRDASVALRKEENKTLLLPADLEYNRITIPPEEAQFLETRKLTRSEIGGIFNVPSHMINDLEKATFSNVSELAIQFVRHTMMPWVVKWEQELNRKLFTRAERKAGYYVKFNLAGLLRGTPKERAEFYHYGITDGWMSRQEARVFEDMNPVKGLDEMLVSVNAAKQANDAGKDEEVDTND
ncbi:phage portal protein [Aliidiomarina sp. Khilg15.8]